MKTDLSDSQDGLHQFTEFQIQGVRLLPSPADQWERFKALPPRLQEERFLVALDLLWKGMWNEEHDPEVWEAILDTIRPWPFSVPT